MVIKPVVRGKSAGTIKLRCCSVPGIRALLGKDVDLRTRRSSLIGVSIRSSDTEFLNRFRVQTQNGSGGDVSAIAIQRPKNQAIGGTRNLRISSLGIVDVHAVQRHVGLISSRAGDVTLSRRTRLQTEQIDDVARFEWQLRNLQGVEIVAQAGVLRIDERLSGRGLDFDGFRNSSYCKYDVAFRLFADNRGHICDNLLLEARRLHVNAVVRRCDQVKNVGAGFRRSGSAHRVGLRIGERQSGARNNATLRVRYRSADGRGTGLAETE